MRRLTPRLRRRKVQRPPGTLHFPILLAADESVSDGDRERARAVLAGAARHAYRPVVDGHVTIRLLRDPGAGEPPSVKASLHLGGHSIRAHAEAPTVREALDRVEVRLRRNLDDLEAARRAKWR